MGDKEEIEIADPRIMRTILLIALPAVGSYVLRMLVTTVDMIMVGRLGHISIGAVGTSNILIFLFQSVMIALSTGSMIVIAHHMGKKRYDDANEVLSESTWLSLVLGGLFAVVGFIFGRGILSFITDNVEVLNSADGYLKIVMFSLPLMFFGFISANCLRGAGDTRTPLLVDLVTNILNMVLDYLLIFGVGPFPAMGVEGAALATTIAFSINALIYFLVLASGKTVLRIRPSMGTKHISEILFLGLPASIERAGIQGSNFLYTGMVGLFGPTTLAAHLIGIRVESLSFMPGFGFYTSSAVLVGQSLGSGNEEMAKKYAVGSMKVCMALMGAIGIFMLIFPQILSGIFTNEAEVIEISEFYIRLMGISQVFTAIDFAMTGALRGSGNTLFPMYATLASRFLIRLPIAYYLGYTMSMGINGVWLGMMADMAFKSVLVFVKFKRDGFKGARYSLDHRPG